MVLNLRYSLLLSFFFFCTQLSISQESGEYDLLWEIQHKNSIKKSYLFGTAHLADKRVFNQPDELVTAIQQSDIFALELNPDSLNLDILNGLYKKEYTAKYKSLLSKREWKTLNELVREKSGTSVDSLEYNSLMSLEELLQPSLKKENDLQTFLDAYLFSIAQSEDKEFTGLEVLEDQIPKQEEMSDDDIKESLRYLLEYSEDEFYSDYEKLVTFYEKGNLSNLVAKLNLISDDDSRLVRRNIKMTNRIEAVMQEKTIFAAVGAAHLPGNNGIIERLRKKGFNVQRVTPHFTKKFNDYKVKLSIDKWRRYEDVKFGYTVLQPKNYEDTMTLEAGLDMQVSADLSSGVNIFHMAIDLRNLGIQDDKKIMELLVDRLDEDLDGVEPTQKTIQRNGRSIVHFEKTDTGRLIQIEFINQDGILYLFGAEGQKNDQIQNLIEDFFNSVTISDTINTDTQEWMLFTSEKGAFSVNLPRDPTKTTKTVQNPLDTDGSPYLMHLHTAVDTQNKTNYIIRYNDFPKGYYLQNIEKVKEGFTSSFVNAGATIINKQENQWNGYASFDYEVLFKDKYHGFIRYINRGNRTYLILAHKLVEEEKVAFENEVFNSFEFAPILKPNLKRLHLDNDSYSILFPEDYFVVESNDETARSLYKTTKDYRAIDENSGDTYVFSEIILGKYFHTDNVETYYDEAAEELLSVGDSLYRSELVTENNILSKYYYYKNNLTPVIQKFKFSLIEGHLIMHSIYADEKRIDSPENETYFKSLKLNGLSAYDVKASMTSEILKDLKSKDSLVQSLALDGLDYYEFDKEELPLLERALSYEYPNDTLYYGPKNMIILNLKTIGDTGSLELLKEMYFNKKSSVSNRLVILETAPHIASKNAVASYFDLLEGKQPDILEDYNAPFFTKDQDSLFDVNTYGNRIMSLYKRTTLQPYITSYIKRKLLADTTNAQFFKEHISLIQNNFFNTASKFIDLNEMDFEQSTNLVNYIEIFEQLNINSPDYIEKLEQLALISNGKNYINLKAFNTTISEKEPIDTKWLADFLDNLYYRFEGMQELINIGKSTIIPKEYTSDQAFSKLSLYNTVGENISYPETLDFQGSIESQGKTYNVFTYQFENSDKVFLGAVEVNTIKWSNFEMWNAFYSEKELDTTWKEAALELLGNNN